MNGTLYKIATSINFSLILLWTYAAVSKLVDYQTSRSEMLNQALPAWMEEILAWAIPVIELLTVMLLLINKTRVYGQFLSLVLLIVFTGYIALVQLNYFGTVPCSCGGVISSLSWEQHFLFNLMFIVFAASAILLERNRHEFIHD